MCVLLCRTLTLAPAIQKVLICYAIQGDIKMIAKAVTKRPTKGTEKNILTYSLHSNFIQFHWKHGPQKHVYALFAAASLCQLWKSVFFRFNVYIYLYECSIWVCTFFFYQIFLSEKEKKTHTYFFALPSVSLRVAACHWVLSSFFSVCWHNLFYLTDVIAIEKGGRVRISHHANYVHIFFDVNAMVLILMLSLIRSICLCFPIKRSCHRTECE